MYAGAPAREGWPVALYEHTGVHVYSKWSCEVRSTQIRLCDVIIRIDLWDSREPWSAEEWTCKTLCTTRLHQVNDNTATTSRHYKEYMLEIHRQVLKTYLSMLPFSCFQCIPISWRRWRITDRYLLCKHSCGHVFITKKHFLGMFNYSQEVFPE